MMDTQFIDQHGSDQIDLKVRKMIDKISWIFRSVDWNNDGMPDNIGFSIVKVKFYY